MEIQVRKPTPDEEAELRACPTWEKEPSTFPWHYDEQETCLVLEGEVEVQAGDETVHIGPGDYVVFPEGLDCTWTVTQPLRKHYKFGE